MPITPAESEPKGAPCSWREPWSAFAHWAAGRLGVALEFDGAAYALRPRDEQPPPVAPAPQRSGLGSSLLSLRRRRPKADPQATQGFASAADLAEELLARLDELSPPPDLAPIDQPERVRDLAPVLLSAYRVDGGQAHVSGCHFEDTPFVRVTRVERGDGREPAFRHALFDRGGAAVDERLADALGLRDTRDIDYHPAGDASPPGAGAAGQPAPAVTGVVWAKWVVGSLQLSIGEQSLRAPFAGWARSLEPPPVTCPLTGRQTFHLAALDDGAIAAAEEIAACEVSGRRLLRRDLVTCSASGKLVAHDLCDTCCVSGEPALRELFTACPRCGQRVSHALIDGDRCAACRSLRRVPAGDPRRLALLAAHPALQRLRRWRLAETHASYLVQGTRGVNHYLLVLDRQDLGLRRACRLTMLGAVRELPPQDQAALLAG